MRGEVEMGNFPLDGENPLMGFWERAVGYNTNAVLHWYVIFHGEQPFPFLPPLFAMFIASVCLCPT